MEEVAEILLNAKAVTLRTDPPFTYTSGIKSPIYTDNRLLISLVEERNAIIDAMVSLIEKSGEVDLVAGTATAGIPWAAWIAERLDKPMVYVRADKKGHGKQNQIEGTVKVDQRAVVVEDLISSGGSSIGTISALRSAGAKAERCFAIFSYELKKAEENFKQARTELVALTGFHELIKLAEKLNYIDGHQRKLVLAWNKDPEHWGV